MTDSTTPSTLPRSTCVRGRFHDRSSVVRAVEDLAQKDVPADAVRVFVLDPGGGRREIAVEDESGVLRGALAGAGFGALAGLLVTIAVATGALGPVGVGFLSIRGLSGALRAMLALAAAAVPVGGLLGMGYWQGRKKIDADELDGATAVVSVHSDELAELAKETLRDAGASEVEVSDPGID